MTARGRAPLLVLGASACGGNGGPLAGDDHDHLLTGWEHSDQGTSPSGFRIYEGETHCEMDSALILEVRWPLDGTENVGRTFVRDPEGVFAEDTAESFDPDAELPDGAVPTGYENDAGLQLWLADDLSTAYAVDSDTVEAWPALPGWICA